MSESSAIDAYETHLETAGVDTGLLETKPAASLTISAEDRVGRPSLYTLPELQLSSQAAEGELPDLEIIDTLGEGGMGVVELARQIALDREVAVKTLREETEDDIAQALLAEAFVTGRLEHPNIIPVYTVGRDADRNPMIVMKRIQGTSWHEQLDADHEKSRNRRQRDIEILVQVASAVHFAHSRGVLHRDIKPENVMLGDFDEVYLVDWGLAIDLDDLPDAPPETPDRHQICGSPVYMAPEMANGDAHEFDERTDVYLLGATLHHALVGRPRHTGETILQIMFAASESEPFDYPDKIPDELAEIANTACRREKKDRFASAEEFRDALRDALEHRESVRIAISAEESLDELQTLVVDEEPDTGDVHDRYGECRFGFEQALRIWPDNESARHGLQRCLEVMADHHLQQQNLDAARGCIAELPEPNPELHNRADELAEHLEAEERDLDRLRDMERDLDLTEGTSARSLLMVVLGVIWTASSLYAAIQYDLDPPSRLEELRNHMIAGFRNFGIATVAVALFRKRIFTNLANRRLVFMLMAILTAMVVLRSGTWYLEGSIELARIAEHLVVALALVAIGLMSDLRICLFALSFIAAAGVTIVWPGLQIYALSAALATTFGGFAWIWRPSQAEHRVTL